MFAKLSLLLVAALYSAAWAQDCGNEARVDALRRALMGRSIDGHVFTSPPALDSACVNQAGDWAALAHWNDATGGRTIVFAGRRVIARMGDSVAGRYLAALTSDSRVVIRAGRIAFSAWYSETKTTWLKDSSGRFGVFVEDAPGVLRLARTLDLAAPFDDWMLTDDGRILTAMEQSVASPTGLENDPGFQRLSPELQKSVREFMAELDKAIADTQQQLAQPPTMPSGPEVAERPKLSVDQPPQDYTDAAEKPKKPKFTFRPPKLLTNLGSKVGVEVETKTSGTSEPTKQTRPCPAPVKQGAK